LSCFFDKESFNRIINGVKDVRAALDNGVADRAGVGVWEHTDRSSIDNDIETAVYLGNKGNIDAGIRNERKDFVFKANSGVHSVRNNTESKAAAVQGDFDSHHSANAAAAYKEDIFVERVVGSRDEKAIAVGIEADELVVAAHNAVYGVIASSGFVEGVHKGDNIYLVRDSNVKAVKRVKESGIIGKFRRWNISKRVRSGAVSEFKESIVDKRRHRVTERVTD
jgi:hypothetical protein